MKLIVILGIMFALLLASLPVAFSLGSLGLGMLLGGGFSPLMAPQAILSTLDGFILLAVPLFLLMSNILLYGGCGRDLYAAVQAWVGHWPGGLAIATIISCGIFAAISGVSVATAATIGVVAIPEMIERGYNKKFVYGLLAAGGTLGILIPPSLPMIVYGFITEESVISLFLAGIGPGLFLIALFIVYSIIYAHLFGGYTPSEKAPWDVRIKTSIKNSKFKNRIYSLKELKQSTLSKNKVNYFSKRFAAKEAFAKALGTGFRKNLNYKDIEVINDKMGKPYYTKSKKITKLVQKNFKVNKFNCFLSISDEKDYSTAFTIIQSL